MQYAKICIHECWGRVYVLGQCSTQQDGLVILYVGDDKDEARLVAETLAKEFNCQYGCNHPYVLEGEK
jgi:ABC-type sugar transport system substrate-binding protein